MPFNTKEKINAYQSKKRREKILNGICVRCLLPAIGGFIVCAKHREKDIIKSLRYNNIYRERLIRDRRCVRCAVPLEEDEGRTCMNCSHKKLREEMVYATHRI